jgi:hypothetical protein
MKLVGMVGCGKFVALSWASLGQTYILKVESVYLLCHFLTSVEIVYVKGFRTHESGTPDVVR